MREGVAGEVGEIAPGKGALGIVARLVEHGPAGLPVMAVRIEAAGELFRLDDVGADTAVEVLVGEAREQQLQFLRQQRQAFEQHGPVHEVRHRTPGQGLAGAAQEERRDGDDDDEREDHEYLEE